MTPSTITWLDSNLKYYSSRAPHHLLRVTISTLTHWFNQPPLLWVLPQSKLAGCEVDHLHAQSEKLRMCRVIPPQPYVSLRHATQSGIEKFQEEIKGSFHFTQFCFVRFCLNAIWHRRCVGVLIFCRRLAGSDVTVTPSVTLKHVRKYLVPVT
jgi:hypothetical protein